MSDVIEVSEMSTVKSAGHVVHRSDDDLNGTSPASQIDWREQLFNQGAQGPAKIVQLPSEAITEVNGVLFDLDPDLLRPEVVTEEVISRPDLFFETVVRPWLDRHPLLRCAEVRNSGRGLHVIPRFAPAIQIQTDAERRRLAGIVQTVQRALPCDPNAPGLTALTRPVGSINGKVGRPVVLLKQGTPTSLEQLLDLYARLRDHPFRTVQEILFGTERVHPCPLCKELGSSLGALDRVGRCYPTCGKVGLAQLYDLFLKPAPSATE
jgi:hypothetical protein